MSDLTGLYQVCHRTHGILDRHLLIDAMLIVQVNDIDLEPLEAGIASPHDIVG